LVSYHGKARISAREIEKLLIRQQWKHNIVYNTDTHPFGWDEL
jgi:hypothetical protein